MTLRMPANLAAFTRNRTCVDIETGSDVLGVDPDFFEGHMAVFMFYADSYVTVLPTGKFWTLIGRDEFFGDSLADVAAPLWFYHVATQIDPQDMTTEWLTDLVNEFAAYAGLEPASADEMLFEGKPDHVLNADHALHVYFLEWFCDVWGEVQEREDKAVRRSRAATRNPNWFATLMTGGR